MTGCLVYVNLIRSHATEDLATEQTNFPAKTFVKKDIKEHFTQTFLQVYPSLEAF